MSVMLQSQELLPETYGDADEWVPFKYQNRLKYSEAEKSHCGGAGAILLTFLP